MLLKKISLYINIMFKLISFFIMFFFYPSLSYAYLDPGTGSILLQAILGGIAIAFASIQIWWHKLKLFLTKILKRFKQPES